jgi:hypothetical protein
LPLTAETVAIDTLESRLRSAVVDARSAVSPHRSLGAPMESFNDPLAAWLEPNADAVASDFSESLVLGPHAPWRIFDVTLDLQLIEPLFRRELSIERYALAFDCRKVSRGQEFH